MHREGLGEARLLMIRRRCRLGKDNGHRERLPIGGGLEKFTTIQHEPCMPLRLLIELHHPTGKLNSKAGAASEKKSAGARGKQFPFE